MTPVEFSARWLTREDAKIHRCTCGAWIYADHECTACGPQTPQECAQTLHTDPVPIPSASTGGVHGGLSRSAGSGDAGVVQIDGGVRNTSSMENHERRAG